MNVIVYLDDGSINKVYIDPKVDFEFYRNRQVLLMNLNNKCYRMACDPDTLFDLSKGYWRTGFNLLPSKRGYVIDTSNPMEFRTRHFNGFEEKLWDKKHAR